MYRRRLKHFIEYTAPPLFFIAVILTITLLLSFRNLIHQEILLHAVIIVCASIFAFTLLIRIILEVAARKTAVHARYTYIEIGLKDIIISLYAGSFAHFGERTVLRTLYVIPLKEFEEAGIVNRKKLIIKGNIKEYTGNDQRLGYFFKDGTFEFKEAYYESQGFKEFNELVLPALFGRVETLKQIIDSFNAAKARFNALPPPKPYVFREMEFVKIRKIRKKLQGKNL